MSTFTHLVLTRFNVRTDFGGGVLRDTEWHHHRFNLFERFCLPSLQGQRDVAFKWIVFFDRDTDDVFKAKIDAYARWDRFIPYHVDVFSDAKLQAVSDHLESDATHLITTRVDTDDALGRDYLANVQRQFHGQEFEFINFPHGYIFDTRDGQVYNSRKRSNAFISLIETVRDFRTVYCGGHKQLENVGPCRSVETGPSWLIVVHGKNSSTRGRKRGPAVSAAVLDSAFTLNLEGSRGTAEVASSCTRRQQ